MSVTSPSTTPGRRCPDRYIAHPGRGVRRGRALSWGHLVLAQVCLASIVFTGRAYATSDSSSERSISLTGPTPAGPTRAEAGPIPGDLGGAPGFPGGRNEITTTCTDPANTANRRRHNAWFTIDNFKLIPEPGSPKRTPFHLVLSGQDFSIVPEGEGMRMELYPGLGPLQSTLRCHFRASIRPRPQYRIRQVHNTVISGSALNAMRSNAVVTTKTTLGGVALPATIQTNPEAQNHKDIRNVSIPALNQCSGQPLALDVLIRVKASRVDVNAHVIADFDSYDLRFEPTRCP